jgi:hypothetical protein
MREIKQVVRSHKGSRRLALPLRIHANQETGKPTGTIAETQS